ncbi:Transmembrane protein 14C [Ophiophagus hannah]|uniref:Transmembrane protein 14C n=1 Tax=Ophiophagus hannah TaxID=8665 RepID=V8NUN2_OPHHA|nr:Transmembrane protein 14C [Ophiophagus hannah]
MSVDWLGYGYAALVASGGVAGYVKAGSVPSLAAGLLCGGLAGLGAYQQSTDPKNIWLSLAASGTLTVLMGMRYYNSRKFMPAGLIAGARGHIKKKIKLSSKLNKIGLIVVLIFPYGSQPSEILEKNATRRRALRGQQQQVQQTQQPGRGNHFGTTEYSIQTHRVFYSTSSDSYAKLTYSQGNNLEKEEKILLGAQHQ